jgi:hypothetical protein
MARRRQMRIDPSAFLQQQEDGGMGDLETLMKLLGLGEGQGEQERLNKAQQSQQAYYEGLIGQQQAAGGRAEQELADRRAEAKAAGEERLAAAALRKLQEEELINARNRDIQYKKDALAQAAMEKALEGVTDPKERQAIIGNFNPEAAAAFQKGEEAKKGIATEKFSKELGKAYKTAGEKGTTKGITGFLEQQEKTNPYYEELLKSADWPALNAGLPAPQPGILDRLLGAISGKSVPTPPPPVGQGGATPVEGRRRYGSVPGQETTGKPLTEIIGLQDPLRYIREQAKPPVEVVPEKPFSYEEGYPSAQPNYMSGIQTPLPMDVINRIESDPRYMSAEQELLKSAMDWWNKGAPAPSGGPSAMPPRILPLGQMAPF